MYKIVFLFVFLLYFSESAAGQYCQIKGDLLDFQTQQKLDSVKIEIYEGKMMYKIIYTDSAGSYDTRMFQVVGPVSFRISRDDYTKEFLRFGKLKGNNVIFMDIKLQRITEAQKKKNKTGSAKESDTKTRKKKYVKVKRRSALPF